MPVVFVMSKLRPGVRSEDYEKFVREIDYPTTQKNKDIFTFYKVYKITGTFDGSPSPYDYAEHIVITDVEKYKKLLESPDCAELLKEWSKYIGEYVYVFTEEVG